ncbi:MBL fold metallo-hydrolase [Neolewinella agarilytica]|uniref:Pyrroloquinoline quinone biosynthesis protein B n=1 Tax=Neolewinella agarilytica TaxID=478744 RepID=A0A1H9D6K7_9BACT|nr:MBL fold metallo-hydrolase [Neolewinella agarilytica]SEQ08428.1 pyrroloquinoline quinone biosynthesis protein B [Neolewinella agarilytica]
MKFCYTAFLLIFLFSCSPKDTFVAPAIPAPEGVSIVVLGNVQDAGSPHIGCKKDCCRDLFDHPDATRMVTCLGLVDASTNQKFLFEASPDISRQLKKLKAYSQTEEEMADGIFLTHAHIGHYTGLMYLGKEATNADQVPVYAMPRMRDYLSENGPWSQLVSTKNIKMLPLTADSTFQLTASIRITPFRVPHRDEYSETVGYRIDGPNKSALFIPDIDKWERWGRSIEEEIRSVDYAFLDATFYDAAELNTRDISLIPHPFVSESMERFSKLPGEERAKIQFIHFNHTNQLLKKESAGYLSVEKEGYGIADFGEIFDL